MREHWNQSYTTPRFSRFDWLEIIDKNRAHFNVARDRHAPSILTVESLDIVARARTRSRQYPGKIGRLNRLITHYHAFKSCIQ